MPKPKPLPPHIPFAPSRSLIVALPPEYHGKVDVYIGDTIVIGPYLPGIIPRLAACILLFFHLVFRPLSKFEPIPRDEASADAKLISERGLEETKTIRDGSTTHAAYSLASMTPKQFPGSTPSPI